MKKSNLSCTKCRSRYSSDGDRDSDSNYNMDLNSIYKMYLPLYCMTNKPCPFSYCEYTKKIGQDFLDFLWI